MAVSPSLISPPTCPDTESLSIIILGANSKLAASKIIPAVFRLYCTGLLPESVVFCGFGNMKRSTEEFRSSLQLSAGNRAAFKERCVYHCGGYSEEGLGSLNTFLEGLETYQVANRIFYFAVPASEVTALARAVGEMGRSLRGWNRCVVERAIAGRDVDTALRLSSELAAAFGEESVFRIDHYLGKSMVRNIFALRFGNSFFEPMWNRRYVSAVMITFKEDFGMHSERSARQFDERGGIVLDVIQNHLLQLLTLIAMEPPVSHGAEDVRGEKVKVLRATAPVDLNDVVLGQYEDFEVAPGVAAGSVSPTFATCVLNIRNERWAGVPFIIKAGKGLDEHKCEIRVQFKPVGHPLYDAASIKRNELVIRIQPNETVFLRMMTQAPGLGGIAEEGPARLMESVLNIQPVSSKWTRGRLWNPTEIIHAPTHARMHAR